VNVRLPNPVAAAIVVILLLFMLMSFAYGIVVQRYQVFPFHLINSWKWAVLSIIDIGELEWYYRPTDLEFVVSAREGISKDRLNLVTSMVADDQLSIRIIDMDGQVRNQIIVDWFDIWPEATHIPEFDLPQSRPGTHIHGIVMLPNGDVVFNFEQLGLVRMTPCGELVWKLAYRTHHSVFLDEQGDLWVAGQITHTERSVKYPNHSPPFREPMVLKVSTNGEILKEISVFEVLIQNDLRGYLHLSSTTIWNSVVHGGTLHLNDVEVFPTTLDEGIFKHGDIMISLRNISTVLVFDPNNLKIRYITTGRFTRQHDPDFLDGNTISVFDNNQIAPDNYGHQSRIQIISASTGEIDIWYEGSETEPFYTSIMGKNQWLEDGSLLVTDSFNGRAFQLNPNREIVWEFVNLVDEGVVGLVEEVQRLPAEMTSLFSVDQSARCNL